MKVRCVRLAALAFVVLLAVGAAPAVASFPGGNGDLLYRSSQQLVAFDQSTGPATLSTGIEGSYSPDGTKVIVARPGTDCGLWVMNADGSQATRIPSSTCSDQGPAWSPDGTRIVFHRFGARGGAPNSIIVAGADGSGERVVATSPAGTEYIEPDWSPRGDAIAFIGRKFPRGTGDVYTVAPDGTGLTNLTAGLEAGHRFDFPSWAPDGSQLAVVQEASPAEDWLLRGVFVMNADGTHVHPILLTAGCGAATAAAWSPNGQRIAATFAAQADVCTNAADVITMDTDGSHRTPVVADGATNFLTDWQASPPGGPVTVPPAPAPATTVRRVQSFDVAADGTFVASAVRSSDPDEGQVDVFAYRPGGTFQQLTNDGSVEGQVSVADDHRVAYSNEEGIRVRNGDGSGRVVITTNSSCGTGGPALTPDGSSVVYVDYCNGTYLAGSDGSNPTQLTAAAFYNAEVSADGTRIAGRCFDPATSTSGICTMGLDGTSFRVILADVPDDHYWTAASWSPDGSRLVSLQRDAGGATHIVASDPDGGARETLPAPDSGVVEPLRWLPDGRIGYLYDAVGDGRTTEIRFIGSVAPVDTDGDGVTDDIDAGAGRWDDHAGTTGSITSVDAGVVVRVVNASAADEGVEVTVSGPAGAYARLSVCGSTVKVKSGSTVVFTCGSVIAHVVSGEAELVLSSDTTVLVPAGVTIEIADRGSGRFEVERLSGGAVTVITEGQTRAVTGPTLLTAWTFAGFGQPVDNGGVRNVVKAGSAVPLKWRLLDDATGKPVTDLATASVAVATLSCTAGVATDVIEELAASGSALQNLGDGYYQLNWKTDKAYAGTCKTLKLNLGEGITRNALFQFSK